jgi:CheY-like chemotaxis protein
MTFLVVDDHRINQLLIDNFLDGYHVEVIFANDGTEAYKIWENVKIDVLITDHYMPSMDGLELIKKIKSSNKQKTICMLITGEVNLHSNEYDYLYIKPITKKIFDQFMTEVNLRFINA